MPKMKQYDSVEDYFSSQTKQAQKAIQQLKSYIFIAAPHAKEQLKSNIPVYTLTPGGKSDHQIMIAAYKYHLSFYPHPDTSSHFKERIHGYKTGKGTIQFFYDEPLPKELIVEMVRHRLTILNE